MPTKAKDKPVKKNKNIEKYEFTSNQSRKEAAKNGRKGGIASGKARKEKKILKDEILKRLKEKDWDEMILGLIERSKSNDRSFEVLRDTIGQKPKEQIEAAIDEICIKVGIED